MAAKIDIPEHLRLPCTLDSLSEIRFALNRMQARLGFQDEKALILRLVLEELVSNSVMHGEEGSNARDSDAYIEVNFHVADGFLYMRYADHGSPFNPREDLPPDTRGDQLDDRPQGQLGWPLILHYCDLAYYAREADQNRMVFQLRDPILGER